MQLRCQWEISVSSQGRSFLEALHTEDQNSQNERLHNFMLRLPSHWFWDLGVKHGKCCFQLIGFILWIDCEVFTTSTAREPIDVRILSIALVELMIEGYHVESCRLASSNSAIRVHPPLADLQPWWPLWGMWRQRPLCSSSPTSFCMTEKYCQYQKTSYVQNNLQLKMIPCWQQPISCVASTIWRQMRS